MKEKKDKRTALEQEIDDVLELIRNEPDVESAQYMYYLSTLEKLMSLQRAQKQAKDGDRRKIDPNTVISIVGELLGMGFIMNYERIHVLSTKAFQRLWRPRI